MLLECWLCALCQEQLLLVFTLWYLTGLCDHHLCLMLPFVSQCRQLYSIVLDILLIEKGLVSILLTCSAEPFACDSTHSLPGLGLLATATLKYSSCALVSTVLTMGSKEVGNISPMENIWWIITVNPQHNMESHFHCPTSTDISIVDQNEIVFSGFMRVKNYSLPCRSSPSSTRYRQRGQKAES